MKKTINKKVYSTKTATYIASREAGEYTEDLYKKKTGEFFLYQFGAEEHIVPIQYDEAMNWVDTFASGAKDMIFGDTGSNSTTTMCISIPESTAAKVRRIAAENEMGMSEYISRLLESV